MAKNFKIADIKAESRYTVATVDKWDRTAKTEEMTGAQLVAFANAAAHLYDIHAEEIAEPAQTAETMDESRRYCKRIADELETIAAGKAVNEDGEEMGLYDWVNDALDFEYTIDSRRQYKAAKIWVTLGGPNVWVDTAEKAVKLAWGTDRAEYPISYDTADAIDDVMAELWEV